jgi:hypothetical protein
LLAVGFVVKLTPHTSFLSPSNYRKFDAHDGAWRGTPSSGAATQRAA